MTLNSVKHAVEECLPAVLSQYRLASRAMRDGAWVANSTCDKRLAKLGIPQTTAVRRHYRELIITTAGLGGYWREGIGGSLRRENQRVPGRVARPPPRVLQWGRTLPSGAPPLSSTSTDRAGVVLRRSRKVTAECLRTVFEQLHMQRVLLEGMILKPTMLLPGLACSHQESMAEVALATVNCLLEVVPAAVPGIAFLSGGQTGELASARLNAMHARSESIPSPLPSMLTFSFGRAIQQAALGIWSGEETHRGVAQEALLHRAQCNRAARRGEYVVAMELP